MLNQSQIVDSTLSSNAQSTLEQKHRNPIKINPIKDFTQQKKQRRKWRFGKLPLELHAFQRGLNRREDSPR